MSGIGRRSATAFWVLIHGMVCPEWKNSSSEFIPTTNQRSGNRPGGPGIQNQTQKWIIALCIRVAPSGTFTALVILDELRAIEFTGTVIDITERKRAWLEYVG